MSEKKLNRQKLLGKTRYPAGSVTLVLSAVILLALLLLSIILPDRTYSKTEKRTLASMPQLNIEAVTSGTYMDDIETYLSDQFPGRDFAVNVAALYNRLMGPDISNGVLKGRSGWLFQLPAGAGYSETTGKDLIEFLSAYDVNSTILLVPNAVSVASESSELSDIVPAGAVTENQRVWYLGFAEDMTGQIDALGKSEQIRLVDPFDTLTSAWEGGTEVYYRTDHHWTTAGAREVYLQLADAMGLSGQAADDALVPACSNFNGSLISKSGYQVSSKDEVDILQPEDGITTIVYYEEEQDTETSVYSSDGLNGDDPYEVFFGGNHALVRISTDVQTGRKLLVIKDSYANALVPFLIPDFDSIVMVDPRYYNGDIGALMQSESFTDVLVVYNINTFCEDQALSMIIREAGE